MILEEADGSLFKTIHLFFLQAVVSAWFLLLPVFVYQYYQNRGGKVFLKENMQQLLL